MATERAPLSSITNLQLQNRPFPTFNKLVQRDTCDLESCHNSTTRVMGAGKCNVVFSQFRGEKVVCPCQQGVFNYNGTSNVFDDTCQDCLHSAVQHESLSASKGDDLTPQIANRTPSIVPGVSESWTPRPVVVQRILERALKHSVLMVRGTPASGKSILMNLIYEHATKNLPHLRLHVLRGWPSNMSFAESQNYLEKMLGFARNQLFKARNTIICIDDAQSTYYDEELWSFLKMLDSAGASFVLFCSYGSPGPEPVEVKSGTPPIFGRLQQISLQWEKNPSMDPPVGLLLLKDEADDLISRCCGQNANKPVLSSELSDLLYKISGGHAGALSGLVETVINDYDILHKHGRNASGYIISLDTFTNVFYDDPTSARLRECLKSRRFSRGLPFRLHLQKYLHVAKFLRLMSRKGSLKVSWVDDSENFEGSLMCYHRGWIHKDLDEIEEEIYVFPSPLHLWYFFLSKQLGVFLTESRHCQSLLLESNVDYITALSPVMLTVEILRFFRPHKLASPPKAPGMSHGIPPEDWYGKEFYSASDKVSPGAVLWSPEFGNSGVKNGGSLDFYLAAKKWGLEFTREGDRLHTHYARFQPGGNYNKWITNGDLVAWAIIDFRRSIPTIPHPEFENLYHVYFGPNFRTATIFDNKLRVVVDEFALLHK